MEEYDPDRDLAADEWLDLDEQERMIVVVDYHRRHRTRVPNAEAHAAVHTIVENQLSESPWWSPRSLVFVGKVSIDTTAFTLSARCLLVRCIHCSLANKARVSRTSATTRHSVGSRPPSGEPANWPQD